MSFVLWAISEFFSSSNTNDVNIRPPWFRCDRIKFAELRGRLAESFDTLEQRSSWGQKKVAIVERLKQEWMYGLSAKKKMAVGERWPLCSRVSTNGYLSTMAIFLADSPYIDSCFNLSTMVTFFCPQGGRCREDQLQFLMNDQGSRGLIKGAVS